MKQRNIYWVLAVLLGTACTSTSDQFTIDSHIGGLKDGAVVRLMNLEREEHKGELMATDTVRNGAFQLKGTVASPTRCRVEIVLPRHYEDGTPYEAETATVMMVENVAMAIHAEHVDSLPLTWEYMHSPLEKEMNARVTGGRAQQEYTEYRAALHALELEAWQEGDLCIGNMMLRRVSLASKIALPVTRGGRQRRRQLYDRQCMSLCSIILLMPFLSNCFAVMLPGFSLIRLRNLTQWLNWQVQRTIPLALPV
ncbi:DUF4369 domain-containing protein [Bacteroides congonensis]